MYQEELMDHYHHPRHNGQLADPDIDTQEVNPSCGDSVSMQAKVVNNKIVEIAFTGKGCVISQATASMLCEYALHKSLSELQEFSTQNLLELIKISLGPTRLKCALLSLHALQEGINSFVHSERK